MAQRPTEEQKEENHRYYRIGVEAEQDLARTYLARAEAAEAEVTRWKGLWETACEYHDKEQKRRGTAQEQVRLLREALGFCIVPLAEGVNWEHGAKVARSALAATAPDAGGG